MKNHCILPLILLNKYVTDFKEKAEIFNSLINNSSKLASTFKKRSKKYLINSVSSNDIAKLIRELDPNMTSIHMLKLVMSPFENR